MWLERSLNRNLNEASTSSKPLQARAEVSALVYMSMSESSFMAMPVTADRAPVISIDDSALCALSVHYRCDLGETSAFQEFVSREVRHQTRFEGPDEHSSDAFQMQMVIFVDFAVGR